MALDFGYAAASQNDTDTPPGQPTNTSTLMGIIDAIGPLQVIFGVASAFGIMLGVVLTCVLAGYIAMLALNGF